MGEIKRAGVVQCIDTIAAFEVSLLFFTQKGSKRDQQRRCQSATHTLMKHIFPASFVTYLSMEMPRLFSK